MVLSPQESAFLATLEETRRIPDRILISVLHSLLDVFEHNTDSLYADVIHLRRAPDGTSAGYALMAQRMADTLARTWHLRPKAGNGQRTAAGNSAVAGLP